MAGRDYLSGHSVGGAPELYRSQRASKTLPKSFSSKAQSWYWTLTPAQGTAHPRKKSPRYTHTPCMGGAYSEKNICLLSRFPTVLSCFHATNPTFNSQKWNLLTTKINTNLKFNVPWQQISCVLTSAWINAREETPHGDIYKFHYPLERWML